MRPNFPPSVTIIFPDSHAPALEASQRMQPAMSSTFPALPNGEMRSAYSSGESCSEDFTIPSVISEGYTAILSANYRFNTLLVVRILTARRDNVEPNHMLRECRRHLLRHLRDSGLAGRVGKMRHGDAAVRPDGARDDDLAALGQVALLVSRGQ